MVARHVLARPTPRRMRWAAALGALGAAGLYSSANAADDLPDAASAACATAEVRWGYEVALGHDGSGFGVSGVRFEHVPADCDGLQASVTYVDDAGQLVHRSALALGTGAVDLLPAEVPGPVAAARWVLAQG
ncbi:hypothetical protein GC089_15440 [Cellulomonas sp. JZ18]|uniref:hypothetical protein n=1 Tax=Cellulomonas sp. JZ18 TaxID=2654191 RepID=UPI0012D48F33|nr:hypothetical protein [Cellulomonas sp. JZ18]QGQ20327.1 hypothetical protein GC089_15440 [Cellulomonas sp. JZ18]